MSLGRRGFLSALGLTAGSLVLPSLVRHARAADPPKRFVLFYTAQGTVPWRWSTNPAGHPADQVAVSEMAGWSEMDLSDILRPLHGWRDRISVVDGLALVSAEADGDAFRHERAQAHSLTGGNAAWVGGFPYGGEATIDQRIADSISRADRYRSLEISVANGLAYDGYGSVIYRGANQPVPVIDDPRVLWDRLFGGSGAAGDPVAARQGSVMDAVAARYDDVSSQLSAEDRRKLEVHRDLVRSLETQIVGLDGAACGQDPGRAAGYGNYDEDFAQHLGLAVAALSCDLTRVVSFQMGQLNPTQLMAPPGDVHAEYAHGIYDDPGAEEAMVEYGRLHARQFGQILAALDAVPEDGGTLLDNTLVVWMSELADSWHGFDRYPVVVGGGGGALRLGRWIHLPRDTPYEGLQYVPDPLMGRPHQTFLTSVAQAMGLDVDSMSIKSLRGSNGQSIDCSGTIPELMP